MREAVVDGKRPASPTIALSLDNRPLPSTTLPFLSSRVIMGQRPTYEDENGFYSATSLPGSAALPFVISTGAHPDFLPRSPEQRPRVRLSLRKGAYCSPAQQTSTGNPGERSGEISVLMPLLGNVFRRSEAEGSVVPRTFPGNVF
ncbi:MAG: hypothetical protein QOE55_2508 [Acidobacteriaceae bacterium]|nr:hypothetical protein [Acidobacteriaceae bacterium]